MVRLTQYIGLSPEATKFLSGHNYKAVGSWRMIIGIACGDVIGLIYEINCGDDGEGGDIINTYAEIEDIIPWTSDQMVYTALRNLSNGEVLFKWKDEDIR